MIVTAWKNSKHHATGGGYGLKINAADCDRYFRREWRSVILELEGEAGTIDINIDKPSFWTATCHELISADVGRWLLKNRLAPWPPKRPPRLILEPIAESGHFLLYQSINKSQH